MTEQPEQMEQKLLRQKRLMTLAGLVVTIAWAGMGLWLLWHVGFPDGLRLNDIGDFLSGVVAPLAFIWLVIGYFQQGAELSLNSRSLALQVKEMQESVRQQSEQAAAMVRSETHSRRDVLMRVVAFYTDLLASYACDLWRLVEEVSDDRVAQTWDRYSKGDRDIFFFSLIDTLRPISPALPAAVRSEEARLELIHLGEEYLRIYDAFIAELTRLDEAHVLREIYSSGDMQIVKELVERLRDAARQS